MDYSKSGAVQLIRTGITPYREIWELQKSLFKVVSENRNIHYLIVTGHPPVITLGKSGGRNNLVSDEAVLQSQGIEVIEIDRGGDVTYHGPGQVVLYPILDLSCFKEDIDWYLRQLEEVVIATLDEYGIDTERIPGLTGVWVKNNKICAIGVKVTRWVTMHGLALNISTHLDHFNHIIPCGITDKGVTSILRETGNNIDSNDIVKKLCDHFSEIFNIEIMDAINPFQIKDFSKSDFIK